MTDDGLAEDGCIQAGPRDAASGLAASEVAGMRPYCAPGNVRQQTLCKIFAEVLHLTRVGINDDFFALGGRSIDGLFIATRANEELDCELSFVDLFDAPTVAELDRQLSTAIKEDWR